MCAVSFVEPAAAVSGYKKNAPLFFLSNRAPIPNPSTAAENKQTRARRVLRSRPRFSPKTIKSRKLVKMQAMHDAAAAASAADTDARGGSGGGGGEGLGGVPSTGPGSPNSAGSRGERARSSPAGQRPELSPEVEGAGGILELETGAGAGARVGAGVGVTRGLCLLSDLEKKPLLKVFVFLNADEVLRAAQVCRPMFRKVRDTGKRMPSRIWLMVCTSHNMMPGCAPHGLSLFTNFCKPRKFVLKRARIWCYFLKVFGGVLLCWRFLVVIPRGV